MTSSTTSPSVGLGLDGAAALRGAPVGGEHVGAVAVAGHRATLGGRLRRPRRGAPGQLRGSSWVVAWSLRALRTPPSGTPRRMPPTRRVSRPPGDVERPPSAERVVGHVVAGRLGERVVLGRPEILGELVVADAERAVLGDGSSAARSSWLMRHPFMRGPQARVTPRRV